MAFPSDGSDFDFVRRMTPEDYVFPTHRLKEKCAPGKVPLVIVACGSFSPVTLLHLRMFPMALDHAKNTGALDFAAAASWQMTVLVALGMTERS
jgi:hypothetical protein